MVFCRSRASEMRFAGRFNKPRGNADVLTLATDAAFEQVVARRALSNLACALGGALEDHRRPARHDADASTAPLAELRDYPSVRPSVKYSWPAASLRFVKGSTVNLTRGCPPPGSSVSMAAVPMSGIRDAGASPRTAGYPRRRRAQPEVALRRR